MLRLPEITLPYYVPVHVETKRKFARSCYIRFCQFVFLTVMTLSLYFKLKTLHSKLRHIGALFPVNVSDCEPNWESIVDAINRGMQSKLMNHFSVFGVSGNEVFNIVANISMHWGLQFSRETSFLRKLPSPLVSYLILHLVSSKYFHTATDRVNRT